MLTIHVPTCNAQNSRKYPNTFQADPNDLREIRRYVAVRKAWDSSQYKIEPLQRENSYFVYEVVYLDDLKKHFVNGREVFDMGGGKSFGVYYDRARRKVLKEVYFQ